MNHTPEAAAVHAVQGLHEAAKYSVEFPPTTKAYAYPDTAQKWAGALVAAAETLQSARDSANTSGRWESALAVAADTYGWSQHPIDRMGRPATRWDSGPAETLYRNAVSLLPEVIRAKFVSQLKVELAATRTGADRPDRLVAQGARPTSSAAQAR